MNKKYKKSIIFSLFLSLFILIGSIFFLIHRNLLIVYLSLGSSDQENIIDQTKRDIALRKKIKLYYPKEDKFLYEEKALVWFPDNTENLKHLINNWLLFLQEERIINKKIYLESVALDKVGSQAYLSFDVFPLDREWSIFKKWRFLESLFKTIRDAKLGITDLFFMKDNNFLEDDHLDFSVAWPIDGFLNKP